MIYEKELEFFRKNPDKVDLFFQEYKPHKSEDFNRNRALFYHHVFDKKSYVHLAETNCIAKQRVCEIIKRYIYRIYYHYQ